MKTYFQLISQRNAGRRMNVVVAASREKRTSGVKKVGSERMPKKKKSGRRKGVCLKVSSRSSGKRRDQDNGAGQRFEVLESLRHERKRSMFLSC